MSLLEHTIPFLRFPLIVNDAVAVGLTFKLLTNWCHGGSSELAVPTGLVSVLLISLVLTVIFQILHLVYRSKSEDNSWRRVLGGIILRGVAPVLDVALAAVLVVLHVINVTLAGNGCYPTVLMMYCAFGALIASVFHFVLGMAAAHVCLVKWIKHRHQCPTCLRSVNRHPIYVSIRAGKDEECPKYNVDMISDDSESDEGACLITPGSDE